MSRAQWGHGYHSGKEAALNEAPGYIGLFFYTLGDDGLLKHQGVINRALGDGRFLATLYSWNDGSPNGSLVIDDISGIDYLYTDKQTFLRHGAVLMAKESEKRYGSSASITRNHWERVSNIDRNHTQIHGRSRR